jgi:VWFA-related protein
MRIGKCESLALSAVLLVGCHLTAQNPVPADSQTLRSTSRLVVVDVIVTGRDGKFLPGLRAADFIVLDNKVPQPIAGFSENPANLRSLAEAETQPQGSDSELIQVTDNASGEVAAVVLDGLNTEFEDQSYARAEFVKYLRTQLPAHKRLAVYVLGNSLRLVQDFTDDPRLLLAAIEKVMPRASHDYQITTTADPTLPPTSNVAQGSSARTAAMSQYLHEFLGRYPDLGFRERTGPTLAALREVARHLKDSPGRKSIVWVAGSFPPIYVELGRYLNANYQGEIRRVINELADARIAVYGVDARGLVGSPQYGAGRGADDGGMMTSGQMALTPDSLQHFAESTGGKCYTNRNDIANAIALSIADGIHSYEIAYRPDPKSWDGKFHRIAVKLTIPGARARYRSGFYAIDTRP